MKKADFYPIEQYFKKDLLGLLLFGSYARQQSFKTSDKDLLIVLQDCIPIKRNLYQEWDNNLAMHFVNVSPHFVHLPKLIHIGTLWLEVALEGQMIFDRNQQLFGILSKIKQQIEQGKYIRKQAHGHPYWVINKVQER